MYRNIAPSAAAALLLARSARAEFGNSFYLGPFPNGQTIQKATYSMAAPTVPTGFDSADASLWLSVWVGVQPSSDDEDNENLVQPLLNWCADNAGCGCAAAEDGWCAAANTYTPAGQEGEDYVVVPTDATLDFESVCFSGVVVPRLGSGQSLLTLAFLSSRRQLEHQSDRPEDLDQRRTGVSKVRL